MYVLVLVQFTSDVDDHLTEKGKLYSVHHISVLSVHHILDSSEIA